MNPMMGMGMAPMMGMQPMMGMLGQPMMGMGMPGVAGQPMMGMQGMAGHQGQPMMGRVSDRDAESDHEAGSDDELLASEGPTPRKKARKQLKVHESEGQSLSRACATIGGDEKATGRLRALPLDQRKKGIVKAIAGCTFARIYDFDQRLTDKLVFTGTGLNPTMLLSKLNINTKGDYRRMVLDEYVAKGRPWDGIEVTEAAVEATAAEKGWDDEWNQLYGTTPAPAPAGMAPAGMVPAGMVPAGMSQAQLQQQLALWQQIAALQQQLQPASAVGGAAPPAGAAAGGAAPVIDGVLEAAVAAARAEAEAAINGPT